MAENIPPEIKKIYNLVRRAMEDLKEAEEHRGSERRAIIERMCYLTKREIQEIDDLLEKLSTPEAIDSFFKENGIFDSADIINCLLLLLAIAQMRLKIHVFYGHPMLESFEELEAMIRTIAKCSWALNYRWFDVLGFGGRLKIGWRKREKNEEEIKPE